MQTVALKHMSKNTVPLTYAIHVIKHTHRLKYHSSQFQAIVKRSRRP